jgi:hypothetical protein
LFATLVNFSEMTTADPRRSGGSPHRDHMVLTTTYVAAAEAGGWDRAALECPLGVPGQVRQV